MARIKPLAELIDKALGAALAKRGFSDSEIMLAWPDIVGEDLAQRCRPEKLIWPPRRESSGVASATLVVRVERGFSLELQHLTPVLLERLATYFGWRCVDRLRIEQGRLPAVPPKRARAAGPTPEAREKARAQAATIGDEKLRAAVERLGAVVLSRKTP